MNAVVELSSPNRGARHDPNAKSKPRILHVVDSLEIGGLERLVHDLALARGGESTSVACLESVGLFGESLRHRGIRVELIGTNGGFIPTVWRMWRHLRRTQPDLVHCHNLFAFLHGRIAGSFVGGLPTVMTKHGASIPGRGPRNRINHFLIRDADVVAVSRQAMDIVKAWMTGGRPVRYIPNGISMRPYENLQAQEEARAQLGLPERSFIVGIVARVTPVKGHLLLLDVFKQMLSKIPNALLLIVGDGAWLPTVRNRIQELGLDRSVLVMGERRDVPAILAALDVFCLPSETEGMPMTVLEAMAAGLPVVASNVGGIPEVVAEGCTGLMVPSRAADELEAALLALARDPERARGMGRAGRELLLKKFGLESTIGAYEELYGEAIGRRRSCAPGRA